MKDQSQAKISKKPLTLDEMIQHLENNKNITFNSDKLDVYKLFLFKNNYIRIINGYKHYFHKGKDEFGNHIYPNTVNFEEYLNKYMEDQAKIQQIITKVLQYETEFSSISNYVILHYIKDKNQSTKDILNEIKQNLNNQDKSYKYKNNLIINFQSSIDQHGDFVAWAKLSFGNLNNIINLMHQDCKDFVFIEIKKHKLNMGTNEYEHLSNRISRLVKIRNTICHNESLSYTVWYSNNGIRRKDHDRKGYEKLIKEFML